MPLPCSCGCSKRPIVGRVKVDISRHSCQSFCSSAHCAFVRNFSFGFLCLNLFTHFDSFQESQLTFFNRRMPCLNNTRLSSIDYQKATLCCVILKMMWNQLCEGEMCGSGDSSPFPLLWMTTNRVISMFIYAKRK